MFPIDPASGASIFDLHSYRIHTLLKMARKAHPSMTPRLPWIVMTSAATHHDTKACFVENKYFGLPEADVIFFQQGQLPALAYVPVATAADDKAPQPLTVIDHPTRGRIQLKLVMEAPGKLALAPNGNGGLWADMAPVVASEPGLQYIHVVGVDNILMKIADPVMTGYMTHHKVDIMNKVIMKENPEEKVGVLASRHGQSVLVEYSEIKEKAYVT
jgi:UDP-N-acetylglucosamine/UDP-N-acetylgalactosamine diphosphorylase